MPIIVMLGILCAAGVIGHTQHDRGYHYTTNDTENMLREMTGKSHTEKRKIIKRYGRR